MRVEFATSVRNEALKYLQKVYPSSVISDTPESAGPMLDLVSKDIIRVQDPYMYGKHIAIVPGNNWVEDAEKRKEITAICNALHEKYNN